LRKARAAKYAPLTVASEAGVRVTKYYMYTDSVIPLYLFNETKKQYLSVGSGVLVNYKNHKVLVSAAHVFDTLKEHRRFLYLNQTLYEVGRFPVFLNNSTSFSERKYDPVDLAAMPFPKQVDNVFNINNIFVTEEAYSAGKALQSDVFQAIGYPSKKNTKIANKTIKIPGGFRTEGLRYTVHNIGYEIFPHERFQDEHHIATCLTKTAFIGSSHQKTNRPDLHGMSGGLLQKVAGYNSQNDNFMIVVPEGILIEMIKKKAIISVKFSSVFEWLRLHEEEIFA
jgi:hypothetical protein